MKQVLCWVSSIGEISEENKVAIDLIYYKVNGEVSYPYVGRATTYRYAKEVTEEEVKQFLGKVEELCEHKY